jgi:hypothetical protein
MCDHVAAGRCDRASASALNGRAPFWSNIEPTTLFQKDVAALGTIQYIGERRVIKHRTASEGLAMATRSSPPSKDGTSTASFRRGSLSLRKAPYIILE